jgi:hypothetical protein
MGNAARAAAKMPMAKVVSLFMIFRKHIRAGAGGAEERQAGIRVSGVTPKVRQRVKETNILNGV